MRNRLALVCAFTVGCGSADVTYRDGVGGGGDGSAGPDGPLPDAPTMVTLQGYDHGLVANMAFLAMQRDDDPWEVLTGEGGSYTFMVPNGRFGLAWVCPEANTNFVRGWVLFATTRDVSNAALYCPISAPSISVTGSVIGLSAGENAQIAIGSEYTFANTTTPSYSVNTYPGNTDIVARREGGSGLAGILLEHDVPIATGTVHDLDFATYGVAPVISTITVDGKTAAESLSHATYFFSNLGTGAYFGISGDRWAGLPSDHLRGNDVHAVNSFASDSTSNLGRWVDRYVREPADLAVALPEQPAAPTVAVAGTVPYVRLSVTVDRNGAQLYRFLFRYYPGTSLFWTLDASDAWLEAAGTNKFEMPDLSALAGWVATWGFDTSMDQGWDLETLSGNRGFFELWDSLRFQGPPLAGIDGFERSGVRYSGQLTP
jgi:hypothetical protein